MCGSHVVGKAGLMKATGKVWQFVTMYEGLRKICSPTVNDSKNEETLKNKYKDVREHAIYSLIIKLKTHNLGCWANNLHQRKRTFCQASKC